MALESSTSSKNQSLLNEIMNHPFSAMESGEKRYLTESVLFIVASSTESIPTEFIRKFFIAPNSIYQINVSCALRKRFNRFQARDDILKMLRLNQFEVHQSQLQEVSISSSPLNRFQMIRSNMKWLPKQSSPISIPPPLQSNVNPPPRRYIMITTYTVKQMKKEFKKDSIGCDTSASKREMSMRLYFGDSFVTEDEMHFYRLVELIGCDAWLDFSFRWNLSNRHLQRNGSQSMYFVVCKECHIPFRCKPDSRGRLIHPKCRGGNVCTMSGNGKASSHEHFNPVQDMKSYQQLCVQYRNNTNTNSNVPAKISSWIKKRKKRKRKFADIEMDPSDTNDVNWIDTKGINWIQGDKNKRRRTK
eukprot:215160_1